MANWTDIENQIRAAIGDSSVVFHPSASLQTYSQDGQLLLSLIRQLVEVTASLTLTGSPVYHIHDFFPDFVRPLRVVVNGIPLIPSSLANLSLTDPFWPTNQRDPEGYFMIGGTFLGFAPVPGAGTAQVTYLSVPSTTGTGPTVQAQWQQALESYAAAIALAKEAQLEMATAKLKEFVAWSGIRGVRFLETNAQKPAKRKMEPELMQPSD